MKLKLIEPLRYLFKDEVREVGLELGLPEEMVYRQPFPGPGAGDPHHRRRYPREARDPPRRGLGRNGRGQEERPVPRALQSFAVLTDTQTVGVMGDFRTYSYVVAVRAITSEDAMTADWARLPYDVLARISRRIANEVPGVNRVVYDVTSKPPGTIEWE